MKFRVLRFSLLSIVHIAIFSSISLAKPLEITQVDSTTKVKATLNKLIRKSTGQLLGNDRFIFKDTEGKRHRLRVKQSKPSVGGRFVFLTGPNQEYASLLLGKHPTAEFRVNGKIYQILNDKIAEKEESKCDTEELPTPLHAQTNKIESTGPRTLAGTSALTQIDILVAYTNAASFYLGGDSNVEALIDLKIAEANNVVFPNSQLPLRLHKVGTYRDPYYNDSGNYNDLTFVTNNGDIALDQVHTLRNQLGADLVILVNGGSGGIAWLMQYPSTGFAANAFGVVGQSSLSSLTFAHEIGHIFGAHHNRENAIVNGTLQQGAFPFSYGHHFQAPTGSSNTYGTVMSYLGGRIPYFSDPNVSYSGIPTGIPEGLPNEANNAETLRLTAPFVTQFRCAPLEFYGTAQLVNGAPLSIDAQLINNATQIKFKMTGSSPNSRVLLFTSPNSGNSYRRGAHIQLAAPMTLIADSTTDGIGSYEVTVPRVNGNYQFITQSAAGFRSTEAVSAIQCP